MADVTSYSLCARKPSLKTTPAWMRAGGELSTIPRLMACLNIKYNEGVSINWVAIKVGQESNLWGAANICLKHYTMLTTIHFG